jgi:hypothetical protein
VVCGGSVAAGVVGVLGIVGIVGGGPACPSARPGPTAIKNATTAAILIETVVPFMLELGLALVRPED